MSFCCSNLEHSNCSMKNLLLSFVFEKIIFQEVIFYLSCWNTLCSMLQQRSVLYNYTHLEHLEPIATTFYFNMSRSNSSYSTEPSKSSSLTLISECKMTFSVLYQLVVHVEVMWSIHVSYNCQIQYLVSMCQRRQMLFFIYYNYYLKNSSLSQTQLQSHRLDQDVVSHGRACAEAVFSKPCSYHFATQPANLL